MKGSPNREWLRPLKRRSAVSESDEHVCEPERRLDYQLFHRREEIAGLEDQVCGTTSPRSEGGSSSLGRRAGAP